ncbi:hypothetical protein GSI_13919 [Ganoderma sinense ZZ0214-1]|uniref:Uncharacterized protein n=1 Tax=Ganoderma sinense ZZ0214-1 TaxID=1077348 RepID=A0A2G8RRM4_9APHY|nr:hypothetical protein GSI_13919 [Ganoderma sinense ZZ0214-1]
MRLLHTTTGEFYEFDDEKLEEVRYAVLSHMYAWNKEPELSYKAFRIIQEDHRYYSASPAPLSPTTTDAHFSLPSSHATHSWSSAIYSSSSTPFLGSTGVLDDPRVSPKIREACRIARTDNCDYIWVNTCCINDDSTLESTEAIHATFRRFSKASICYAYLADVPDPVDDSPIRSSGSPFYYSRWFNRAWTLQELIAPKHLMFVSRNWARLGTKDDLAEVISDITGIDEDILTHRKHYSDASVARRMYWASRRRATRVEDEAYSLMGLFGVTMQPMYGEGHQAFFRLQQEILMRTQDQSLFAWGTRSPPLQSPPADADPNSPCARFPPFHDAQDSTLFARSTSDFANSRAIGRMSHDSDLGFNLGQQYVFTPYGLRTQLPLIPLRSLLDRSAAKPADLASLHVAILTCGLTFDGARHFVALLLSYDQEPSPFGINVLIPKVLRGSGPSGPECPHIRLITISQCLLHSQAIRQSMRTQTAHLSSPNYVSESIVTVKTTMASLSQRSYKRLQDRGYAVEDENIGSLWFPLRRLCLSKGDVVFEVEYGSTRHGEEAAVQLIVKKCPPPGRELVSRVAPLVEPGSTHWVHSWRLTEFHLKDTLILSFGLECLPTSRSYFLNVVETAVDEV